MCKLDSWAGCRYAAGYSFEPESDEAMKGLHLRFDLADYRHDALYSWADSSWSGQYSHVANSQFNREQLQLGRNYSGGFSVFGGEIGGGLYLALQHGKKLPEAELQGGGYVNLAYVGMIDFFRLGVTCYAGAGQSGFESNFIFSMSTSLFFENTEY